LPRIQVFLLKFWETAMSALPPFSTPTLDARQNYRGAPGACLALLVALSLTAYASAPLAAESDIAESDIVVVADARSETFVGYARGRLLVIPRAGLKPAEMEKEVKKHRGRSRVNIARLNAHIVDLPAGMSETEVMGKLKASRKFKSVELDMVVPLSATVTDPKYTSSWALPKIGAPAAWDSGTGQDVVVAVLDTGVNSSHPDLAANMVAGWNSYDNNADSADVNGHGTNVAGVIAMVGNNGIGSAGVAHRAKIMPVRISDLEGYGFWSSIARGIYWAADHGAKVVNISYNGIYRSSTIHTAAQYMRDKGGVVIVAAGNDATEFDFEDHPSLLAVSATDSTDTITSFSSRGPYVDLSAPGKGIYTTTRSGSYASVSGTSFSAPITAGVAALLYSVNPLLKPADIDRILIETSLDLGEPGRDVNYGHGRVRADLAVLAAGGNPTPAPVDSQAPSVAITSPDANAEIAGAVAVDLSVSDNVGVAKVEFYVNGVKTTTDTSAPFGFSWATDSYAAGDYMLTTRAYDAAGNVGESAPVPVTISPATTPDPIVSGDTTAPVITKFGPCGGCKLWSTVTLYVEATDDVGVAKIIFILDGVEVTRAYDVSTLTHTIAGSTLSSGTHNFRYEVYDAAGNLTVKTLNLVRN
jgi:subtilisin family serine protease